MEDNADIESRLWKSRREATSCEWRLSSMQEDNRYVQEDIDETARLQDECSKNKYPEGYIGLPNIDWAMPIKVW